MSGGLVSKVPQGQRLGWRYLPGGPIYQPRGPRSPPETSSPVFITLISRSRAHSPLSHRLLTEEPSHSLTQSLALDPFFLCIFTAIPTDHNKFVDHPTAQLIQRAIPRPTNNLNPPPRCLSSPSPRLRPSLSPPASLPSPRRTSPAT